FPVFLNNSFFFLSSAILALVSSYAFEMAKRRNYVQRHHIEREKQKSDKLLLNILPESVAKEIRMKGNSPPQIFPNVTVMMADIVGFTEISSRLEPEGILEILNDLFTAFDLIIEQHGCERIKTIGDAYLAVAGMPAEDPDHAHHI